MAADDERVAKSTNARAGSGKEHHACATFRAGTPASHEARASSVEASAHIAAANAAGSRQTSSAGAESTATKSATTKPAAAKTSPASATADAAACAGAATATSAFTTRRQPTPTAAAHPNRQWKSSCKPHWHCEHDGHATATINGSARAAGRARWVIDRFRRRHISRWGVDQRTTRCSWRRAVHAQRAAVYRASAATATAAAASTTFACPSGSGWTTRNGAPVAAANAGRALAAIAQGATAQRGATASFGVAAAAT